MERPQRAGDEIVRFSVYMSFENPVNKVESVFVSLLRHFTSHHSATATTNLLYPLE